MLQHIEIVNELAEPNTCADEMLISMAENENNVDDMPKVKLAVSVGARIVYNKNTKIHILRTV